MEDRCLPAIYQYQTVMQLVLVLHFLMMLCQLIFSLPIIKLMEQSSSKKFKDCCEIESK